MIRSLDQVLKAILGDPRLVAPFLDLAEASISFDRPTEPYSPAQTTINLFLYDIRQNSQLRNNEPIVERSNGQAVIRQPPMRVDCSYLVTAWVVGGEEPVLQEHRLLSQVLQVLSAYPTIPREFLIGTALLDDQEPSLPMMLTQMDGLKNPSEFWTAIGNKLRASLTITVTLSVPPYRPAAIAPLPLVITHELRFPDASISSERRSFQIGGRVTGTAGNSINNALVTLVEPDITTRTDIEGRYQFNSLAAGTYTLRVQTETATQEKNFTIPATTIDAYNLQLT